MPYEPKWDPELRENERIPDSDFEQEEVEGSLIQCGESGVLTATLRGLVEYAFSEHDEAGHWLVLLYKDPKRGIRINLDNGMLHETSSFTKTS